jgi:predicted nucleic acid-binding protein
MAIVRQGGASFVVDTNVWLDLYLPNRLGRTEAKRFLSAAAKKEARILFTLQTANDVFAQVGVNNKRWVREGLGELNEAYSKAIRELSWDCVSNMREIGTVVGADLSDLWLAEKYRALHNDLEDNLVLAACVRAKADYLVTRDVGLIKHSPVAALTPADATKLLAMTE